jgi:hypothetical protein
MVPAAVVVAVMVVVGVGVVVVVCKRKQKKESVQYGLGSGGCCKVAAVLTTGARPSFHRGFYRQRSRGRGSHGDTFYGCSWQRQNNTKTHTSTIHNQVERHNQNNKELVPNLSPSLEFPSQPFSTLSQPFLNAP